MYNNRQAQEKSDVSPFLSFDTRMGQIAKFIQFVQIQGFPWNSTATFVTTMKMLRKVIIALEEYHKKYPKDTLILKVAKEKANCWCQNMSKRELLTPMYQQKIFVDAKIWAKENCWCQHISKRELLTPMYPEAGRRHVYLVRPRGAERCRKRGFGQESGDSYCSSITVFFFAKKEKKYQRKAMEGLSSRQTG